MKTLFDIDNPVFAFLSRVADLCLLNLLFILCSLPIVTMGPALSALYYQTLKMVRNEEGYIVRGFFHSFRQNMRQGIIVHLIMLLAGVLIYADLRIVMNMENGMQSPLFLVFLLSSLLYFMVFIYIYPLLARWENPIGVNFKNALAMAVGHLPQTALMLIVTLLPLIGLLSFSVRGLSFMMLFFIIIGFALMAFINSFFLVRIFDIYTPEEGPSPDEGQEI